MTETSTKPPLIMGIVNATPDSFSDGGTYDPIAQAKKLIEDGADILDIGGESTRPGAKPVTLDEELCRVIPVIEAVSAQGVRLSIDTQKPEVAKAAFAAGATIWNDISALESDGALEMAAHLKAKVVLMHKLGNPQTMQVAPSYEDVVTEVEAYLLGRAKAAMAVGIEARDIWLDPGIGFGKTLGHNVALLRAIPRLAAHGFDLLIGASNKRMIADLEQLHGRSQSQPDQRLGGTIALHLRAIERGARIIRVHDVGALAQAILLSKLFE